MERAGSPLVRLSRSPRLYLQEDFASDAEIQHVLARYGDRAALDALSLAWQSDETGLSSELPIEDDPVLAALARRIEGLLGFHCALLPQTFRLRRYACGDGHPPHVDVYTIEGHSLVATGIVYLTEADEGGETFFPRAEPEPRSITSRRGRLALWFNHQPDGSVDRASLHQSNVLVRGEKVILAYFVYAPLAASVSHVEATADVPSGQTSETRKSRRFVCVNDGCPEATTRVLREACESRGVTYEEVDARKFDFIDAAPLPPGTMLYRPATTTLAMRVEQALVGPKVATFYREPDGPFREIGPDLPIFERAGLPVPRYTWGHTSDRATLRKAVDHLGGLPIVMKFAGGQGGVGVLRIDTLAGLFSTMDHARSSGRIPVLQTYIPDATHWRCIVVGREVVGCYRSRTEPDDFRSYASDDIADYRDKPSAAIQETAIRATAALDVELGGVDLLETKSGGHHLIEVNFPCYFARARLVGGQDVGGAMIDWLAYKADRSGA